MNAPLIPRSILRMHVDTIQERYPLRILGTLPRGSAAPVADDDALEVPAEKRPGLSLPDLCRAEVELGDLLGRPVGIVLVTGLRGREAESFPEMVEAL